MREGESYDDLPVRLGFSMTLVEIVDPGDPEKEGKGSYEEQAINNKGEVKIEVVYPITESPDVFGYKYTPRLGWGIGGLYKSVDYAYVGVSGGSYPIWIHVQKIEEERVNFLIIWLKEVGK